MCLFLFLECALAAPSVSPGCHRHGQLAPYTSVVMVFYNDGPQVEVGLYQRKLCYDAHLQPAVTADLLFRIILTTLDAWQQCAMQWKKLTMRCELHIEKESRRLTFWQGAYSTTETIEKKDVFG